MGKSSEINHNMTSFLRWGRITGFSNKELTPDIASKLGGALGTYLKPKSIVMIGRDYRRDSRALKRAFSGGLMASGMEVIDLHAITTSALQFSVRRFGADAGVMFTRSHNLAGMVSIKLFDSTGVEFPSKKVEKFVKIVEENKIRWLGPSEIGWISVADAMTIYDRAISGFFANKKDLLKEANFRVIVDCGCGPAALIVPDLLSEFGCETITLNAHRPKNPMFFPNPESLFRLRETVGATGADLGIALDAEARHVVIVDSQGNIRTAEETASVNLNARYEPNPNATVVVGETVHPSVYSNINKKIIFSTHREPGCSARLVLEHRAVYGFNDTGLFFLPVFSPGSDAIIASLTVLSQMATEKIKSTELYRKHQIYPQRKAEVTFPLKLMFKFFRILLNQPPDSYYSIDTFIGVKMITENKEWIHFHLTSKEDTLEIEVFDPQANELKQRRLVEFAMNLVKNFLISS